MTYKIGSRWGIIDLRPLFKLYNIAIAGEAGDSVANLVLGDLVAISNGFDIIGIGAVQSIINLNSIDLTLFNQWNQEQKDIYYEVLYVEDED